MLYPASVCKCNEKYLKESAHSGRRVFDHFVRVPPGAPLILVLWTQQRQKHVEVCCNTAQMGSPSPLLRAYSDALDSSCLLVHIISDKLIHCLHRQDNPGPLLSLTLNPWKPFVWLSNRVGGWSDMLLRVSEE